MKLVDVYCKGETITFKKYLIPHDGEITIKEDGTILIQYIFPTKDYEKLEYREILNEGMTKLEKVKGHVKEHGPKLAVPVVASGLRLACTGGAVP